MKIGIVGVGFVGNALKKSFEIKNIDVCCYDKFKEDMNDYKVLLSCCIIFLCLPTCFDNELKQYDTSSLVEVCELLDINHYNGTVVIKSTIEPGTTDMLSNKYKLKLIHNPEFLTAATAFEDFHNQKHIVIGKGANIGKNEDNILIDFYETYYQNSEISICSSFESESMKLFANCFYAVKIQFFNELYLTCKKNGSNYDKIKNLMLKNNWINKMHTNVPGPDGKLSYGGYCFPKDTNALLHYMKKNDIPCNILESTINERNSMRDDKININ
jgi:UDPglucose 6-dehydrogenase